jgi:hypothetical protein
VDKISTTLGCATFVVVRWGRGAAADQLAGYVAAKALIGQGINDLANAGGELPQPLRHFRWRHRVFGNLQFSIRNCQFSIRLIRAT